MSSTSPTKPSLRLGFVGAGRVADVHLDALQACSPEGELAAFCDLRPEAVEARSAAWNVPGYPTLEAMLAAEELDATVVLLPHDVHLPVMRQLLAARLPVLLEKPLAAKLDEAEEIVRLADEADVPVLVGHNGLFHPAFVEVERIISQGWIGRPLFASAQSLQWLAFKPWDFRLSRAQTGGGAWIDCAGHLVYRLNALLGEPTSLTGMTSHVARAEMEGEDTAAAILQYATGPIATVTVSYGYKLPGYELDWPNGCAQSLTISGEAGNLEYHICPKPSLRLFSEVEGAVGSGLGGWQEEEIAQPFEVSFVHQMRHFLACVRGEEEPRVPPSEAAALLRQLRQLYA